MSSYEFSGRSKEQAVADGLLHEAMTLINTEADPVMRGRMIVAAIEEGLPLTADFLLNDLHIIPDDDERGPDVVTPYQYKYGIATEGVAVLAQQDRLEETDSLMDFMRVRDPYAYMQGIVEVVRRGYGGPGNRYFQLTAHDLCALAMEPGHYMYPDQTEYGKLSGQQFYLELYLQAAAEAGVDIFEPGSTYSAMLFKINELGNENEEDPWQIQRRLSRYAEAYMEGGHMDLAATTKGMVQDHKLKAGLCLRIIEHTEDPAIKNAQLLEIMELMEQIQTCNGECGYGLCEPGEVRDNLRLGVLKEQAKLGARDAAQAKEQKGGPKFYYPHEQMQLYQEVYKQTGDDEARRHSLSFLNDLSYYRSDLISSYVREIAEADVRWGRTLPYEGEVTPQVCWEIERVFWGIERYLQIATGDTSADPVVLDPDFERGSPDESDGPLQRMFGIAREANKDSAVGPLSSTFGESASQRDLENCLAQRDRAYVVLASLLTENNAQHAARYFLGKVEGSIDKVRGRVAVAKRLAA